MLHLLRRTLENYVLVEAATAEEALMSFIDHNHQIDLLITDLRCARNRLPTRSGIEVALLLRTKLSGLPVILTSGNPVGDWSDRDAADLQRLGSSSVTIFQKPLQAHVLLNAVNEMLGASKADQTRTS